MPSSSVQAALPTGARISCGARASVVGCAWALAVCSGAAWAAAAAVAALGVLSAAVAVCESAVLPTTDAVAAITESIDSVTDLVTAEVPTPLVSAVSTGAGADALSSESCGAAWAITVATAGARLAAGGCRVGTRISGESDAPEEATAGAGIATGTSVSVVFGAAVLVKLGLAALEAALDALAVGAVPPAQTVGFGAAAAGIRVGTFRVGGADDAIAVGIDCGAATAGGGATAAAGSVAMADAVADADADADSNGDGGLDADAAVLAVGGAAGAAWALNPMSTERKFAGSVAGALSGVPAVTGAVFDVEPSAAGAAPAARAARFAPAGVGLAAGGVVVPAFKSGVRVEAAGTFLSPMCSSLG